MCHTNVCVCVLKFILNLLVRPSEQTRPCRASKKWARCRKKAKPSFILPTHNDVSTQASDSDKKITTADPSKKYLLLIFTQSINLIKTPLRFLPLKRHLSSYHGLSNCTVSFPHKTSWPSENLKQLPSSLFRPMNFKVGKNWFSFSSNKPTLLCQ
jgi:hypothetical protein